MRQICLLYQGSRKNHLEREYQVRSGHFCPWTNYCGVTRKLLHTGWSHSGREIQHHSCGAFIHTKAWRIWRGDSGLWTTVRDWHQCILRDDCWNKDVLGPSWVVHGPQPPLEQCWKYCVEEQRDINGVWGTTCHEAVCDSIGLTRGSSASSFGWSHSCGIFKQHCQVDVGSFEV